VSPSGRLRSRSDGAAAYTSTPPARPRGLPPREQERLKSSRRLDDVFPRGDGHSKLALDGYRTDRVVQHGLQITSRGPGTAPEWGLAIVRELVGEDCASELGRAMLVAGDE